MRRMGPLPNKTGLISALALICVLVWAQSVLLQHGIHHATAGEASPCAVCSVSNGLDSLNGTDQPETPLAASHSGHQATLPSEIPGAPIRSTHIRAPPGSSIFL